MWRFTGPSGYTTIVEQSSSIPPTTLVLIRHGHVADNDQRRDARLSGWFDAPLSPLGWAQAERLRARLEAIAPVVDALYASPLRRARDTADVLAPALGIRPRLVGSLREISCGRVDGLPLARVQQRRPDLWRRNLTQEDDDFRWPGGESYRDFRARALRAVRTIAARHAGGRVVIVTHAGVITQVLGALHGLAAARWGAFVAGNGSISEVQWSGDAGRVLRFDDRAHLVGLLPAPDGVGAAEDPQVVARGARGLGPRAGRRDSPAIGDAEVVAERAGDHVARSG